MKKYKEYYYTTNFIEHRERNNSTPIKLYSWTIYNKYGKDREVMQASEELIEGKRQAEIDCEDHIDEFWQP